MRVKLDENVGESVAQSLREAGQDVATVGEEGLIGAADARLIEVRVLEGRALVTLDMDLSNPIVFPPEKYRGIVVLRPGIRFTREGIRESVRTLCESLSRGLSPDGSLWIVQPGRVRVFEREGRR